MRNLVVSSTGFKIFLNQWQSLTAFGVGMTTEKGHFV